MLDVSCVKKHFQRRELVKHILGEYIRIKTSNSNSNTDVSGVMHIWVPEKNSQDIRKHTATKNADGVIYARIHYQAMPSS